MFFHPNQAGVCPRKVPLPVSVAGTWQCEKGPEMRFVKLGFAQNPYKLRVVNLHAHFWVSCSCMQVKCHLSF